MLRSQGRVCEEVLLTLLGIMAQFGRGHTLQHVKLSSLHYDNFIGVEQLQLSNLASKIAPICSSVRTTSAKAKDAHTCSYKTRKQRS